MIARASVDRYLYYVVERQKAAERRAAGDPPPWSDDPIICDYKFCSVIRDDDRTSREARQIILALPEQLRLPTALGFRLYNRVSTLVALRDADVLGSEDSAKILRVFEGLEADAFCRAYKINIGPGGFFSTKDTAGVLARAARAVRRGEFALRRSGRHTAAAVRGALDIKAPFSVGQIAQDLRWIGGPYEDEEEWATIGPGAVRGLARLCDEFGAEVAAETAASPKANKQRRETEKLKELAAKGFKITKETEPVPPRMLSEMTALLTAMRNCTALSCRDRITLAEVQHNLCEADKFARITANPKKGRRFVPLGTQPATRSKITRQTASDTCIRAAAPTFEPDQAAIATASVDAAGEEVTSASSRPEPQPPPDDAHAATGAEDSTDVDSATPPTQTETAASEATNGSIAAPTPAVRLQTLNGDLANLPAALAPLTALSSWVIWRWGKTKDGKWTKVPYQPNRPSQKAKNNDPTTWGSYETALSIYRAAGADGIGLCLLNSGLAAFDLDHCRNPTTGAVDEWARALVERVASYTEVTVSGAGLRIIGRGTGPRVQRKQPVDIWAPGSGGSLETYRQCERYIVMTGNPLGALGLVDIDRHVDEVVGELDAGQACRAQNGAVVGHDDTTDAAGMNPHASEAHPEQTLSPMLVSLLSIPDAGAGHSTGGYRSRNEALFAFVAGALRGKVSTAAIISACLDGKYVGCAIHQHCRDNGGRAYVERQIRQARGKVGEASELASELMTDLGNARRLVRLCGRDIRYVHEWCSWLVWDSGHWRKDNDGSVMRMAKATVEDMFVEASKVNDENRRAALRKWAIGCQSAPRLAAMIKLAESERGVVLSATRLDVDPYLLGVQNGVIDLRQLAFRAATPEDYVTKLAEVAFDAHADCPAWAAYLNKIFDNDAQLIKYLQRACGYILTGLTGEEVVFLLWGDGNRGKSTFRETIFALMGDYAMGADASLLVTNKRAGGATPDLVRLHGRRLVTVNETSQNDVLNEQRVKFITSHDVITARDLYEGFFDFTPTHKTIVTTQHKPIVQGVDEGIWRRLSLIAFLVTIKEGRDVNFREKMLLPELPGILNWALEGLREYWRIGLAPPAVVTDATQEYREDMDIVGRWIEERCERAPDSQIANAELHADYAAWAKQEVGWAISPIGFGRELANRGFKKVKKVPETGGRGIRGLKLRDGIKPVGPTITLTMDEAEFEAETEKAVLAHLGGGKVWLPRSQITLAEDGGSEITMPEWLAREKGLIKRDGTTQLGLPMPPRARPSGADMGHCDPRFDPPHPEDDPPHPEDAAI
jgi:putative DNA primase/helicase